MEPNGPLRVVCPGHATFGGGAYGASLDRQRGAGRSGVEVMLQIQKTLIQFAHSIQPQLAAIARHDAKLADQLRRALVSVGLNLGEGYGASGGLKRRAYRIAKGEGTELEMGLEIAVALGYCTLESQQRADLRHVLAVLHKLAKPIR